MSIAPSLEADLRRFISLIGHVAVIFFIILECCIVVLFRSIDCSSISSCLPEETRNRWFLEELFVGGFTNHQFSIYSMVPVALLLNSSLIAGPIITRKSFADTWDQFSKGGGKLIPFSYFYDWTHFSTYWSKRNLAVVEKHTMRECLQSLNFSVIHRKEFFYKTDKEILSYVYECNIPVPIPNNYTMLSLGGSHKLVSLYNYWQSDKLLELLHQVDFSLRPNATLARLIDSITAQLGPSYIAVHLRVEADKINYKPVERGLNVTVDQKFIDKVPDVIRTVLNHHCFAQYQNNTAAAPTVYVASGVFHSFYRKAKSSFMSKRAYHSLGLFKQHGYTNVFTQFNLTGDLLSIAQSISPEQLAYVEQEVSRRSACFVHDTSGSSFSYMVVRLQQIDRKTRRNETLTKADVKLTSIFPNITNLKMFDFWGF